MSVELRTDIEVSPKGTPSEHTDRSTPTDNLWTQDVVYLVKFPDAPTVVLPVDRRHFR